jgi:peptide/nickel transport system ATP-binding protein
LSFVLKNNSNDDDDKNNLASPVVPPPYSSSSFLEVRSISKRFAQRAVVVTGGAGGEGTSAPPGASSDKAITAVDRASFQMNRGEVIGLVGESGSGKTTLGKILVNLLQPDSGEVSLEGRKIIDSKSHFKRKIRKEFSMVFQDPYEALNPAKRTFDIVAFPARVNGVKRSELGEMVFDSMRDVKLTPPEEFASKYPHQLSGGQRQRVAIARAIILRPRFLVLDEPTSMLDASLKVGMIELISDILRRYEITAVLITHDLAVAAKMCSRLIVMYRGSVVEEGHSSDIVSAPSHPYTKSLISAIPQLGRELEPIVLQDGGAGGSILEPSGVRYCKFFSRCPWAFERCKVEEPDLYGVGEKHSAKCFLYA